MTLDILDKDSFLIKIKESGWKEIHKSLDKYYSHCKIWSANAMWHRKFMWSIGWI